MKRSTLRLFVLQFLFFIELYADMLPLTLTLEKGRLRPIHISTENNRTKLLSTPSSTSDLKYYYFSPMPSRAELMPLPFQKDNEKNNFLLVTSTNQLINVYTDQTAPRSWIRVDENKHKGVYNEKIDQYVWGKKVFTQNIPEFSHLDLTCDKSNFDMNFKVHDQFRLIDGLWIFYDKSMKRVVAVQYELFSRLPNQSKTYENLPKKETKIAGSLELPHIDVFPENSVLPFINIDSQESLILIPLASPNHFMFASTAKIKENLVPSWDFLTDRYNKIDAFISNVMKSVGDLIVTAGTTVTDSADNEVQYLASTIKTFIVPKLIWKAVEFQDGMKTYGIIIVMVNSNQMSSENICKEDVCAEREWWVKTFEDKYNLYCCDMTKEAIQNLKVSFLSLKDRIPFNLRTRVLG